MGHIRYKLNQPRRKKYPLILQFFIDYTNLDPNEMKTSPIDGRIILAFLGKEGWVVGRVNKRKGVIDIGESNKQLEELVAWNDLEIKKKQPK